MPDVSVIVPIYNGEQYIDDCMTCLFAQTHENFEIVLVNDGSKDRTQELCDGYAQKDSRITVVHQENAGVSTARNAGIKAAHGKYIYFFDVDDKMDAKLIEDNFKLANDNDADLVMFGFRYFNVDEQKYVERPLGESFVGNAEDFFHNCLIETMDHEVFNAPWNKLIRKDLFENAELVFDSRYSIYEDIIFATKLLQKVNRIVVNHNMYYDYYLKSSGSLLTRFFEEFFDSVSQLYLNAMEYCAMYTDNEKQIKRFNKLYSDLTVMHLKQISCQETLTADRKQELMLRICNDTMFIAAINNTDYTGNRKKMIVRQLINHKRVKMISWYYRHFS